MNISEFDAARVALARKHGKEQAFINSLLLDYVRYFVKPERLQDAIDTLDELMTPKDAA